jgi:hypothetical protein
MRLNSFQLIKSCGTRPDGYRDVPADKTKPIGLRADPTLGEGRRAGAWFFARHLDYFIMTQNLTSVYRDLVPSRQLHRETKFSSVCQDWPALTTETNPHPGLVYRSVGRAKTTPPRSASWLNAN